MEDNSIRVLAVIEDMVQAGVQQPYTLKQIRDWSVSSGIDLPITKWDIKDILEPLASEGLVEVTKDKGVTLVSTGGSKKFEFGSSSSWSETRPLTEKEILERALASFVKSRVKARLSNREYRKRLRDLEDLKIEEYLQSTLDY